MTALVAFLSIARKAIQVSGALPTGGEIQTEAGTAITDETGIPLETEGGNVIHGTDNVVHGTDNVAVS